MWPFDAIPGLDRLRYDPASRDPSRPARAMVA